MKRMIVKKEVEKIKKLHVEEVFHRFYVMKQNIAMWMNCYGQDIMKEVLEQMTNEVKAIERGNYKTLKDDKGNDINCSGCKKPIVTWPGLENKASDGKNYCFGCYSNKHPEEWKVKLAAFQEAETKKKQEIENKNNKKPSEDTKKIELKLNNQLVGDFWTERKEDSYKISDVRMSWDENKYSIILGNYSVVVDRDKVENKEEVAKSFLIEIFENGNLVDSRRISKTKKSNEKESANPQKTEESKESDKKESIH